MTTQLAEQAPSQAISKIASNLCVSTEELTLALKRMIISAKGDQAGAVCTNAELMILASTCAKYDLNPIVKEIHAFMAGGKLMFHVGIDGWFKIMSRHPKFNGLKTHEIFDREGNFIGATAELYLKGVDHPICATEYLAECERKQVSSKTGKPIITAWQSRPRAMTTQFAIKQAIRRGMGISELIDDEDKERIIESMPQQQQVQHYQQDQFIQSGAVIEDRGVSIDDVKKAFAVAKNHHDLQVIAGDLRKKLEASGSFAAMKAEIMQVYNQVKIRLDEQSNVEEAQIVDHGGMIDTATGEVLPDDDLVPFE